MERQNFKYFRSISQFAFFSCRAASRSGTRRQGRKLPSSTMFTEVAFPWKNSTFELKDKRPKVLVGCSEAKGRGCFSSAPNAALRFHHVLHHERYVEADSATASPTHNFFTDPSKRLGRF